jgi:hydrogenase-4 component E
VTDYASVLLVTLLALDLYMVSTSRLDACIRTSRLQAVALAGLPFTLGAVGPGVSAGEVIHLALIAAATLAVKGVFIPWLLLRALRDLGVDREFEPYVSLHLSQLVNGALVGASFWIASALPWPGAHGHTLAFGVGLSTLFVGLYMTINRRTALSQVLGYLVIESGLFVIGWALLGRPSLVVELGALLDVLVAIMVMGILATHLDTPPDASAAPGTGGGE